jgi:hypothetical protein
MLKFYILLALGALVFFLLALWELVKHPLT